MIKRIEDIIFEPSNPTIVDDEAYTVLELVEQVGTKTNEVVTVVNDAVVDIANYKALQDGEVDTFKSDVNVLIQPVLNLEDEVNASITELSDRVNNIITTPVDSVSAQEIIDARGGETTLGGKLNNITSQLADIEYVNVMSEKFNVVGDGVADDTIEIQKAIDYCISNNKNMYVPEGFYLVSTKQHEDGSIQALLINDAIKILLHPKAILKLKPNNLTNPTLLRIKNCSNVTIEGGQFLGDKNEHLGSTGESGDSISILGSSYVYLKDLVAKDNWGDGISIWYTNEPVIPHHIYIENVTVINNSRNGFTVGSCENLYITRSEFSGTNRTAPMAGIDIEPDGTQPPAKNIFITECTFNNNGTQGVVFGGGNGCDDIWIMNCKFNGNRIPINMAGSYNVKNIQITKNTINLPFNGIGVALKNANGGTIADNTIHSSVSTLGLYGIYVSVLCNNFTIKGNHIYDLVLGIFTEAIANMGSFNISNNTIHNVEKALNIRGINCLIDKNILYDLTNKYSIFLEDSIMSNNIIKNTTLGVMNLAITNSVFTNNSFKNVHTSTNGGDAMIDLNKAENCTISNNYFDSENNTQIAMYEVYNPTKPSVINNNFARYGLESVVFVTKPATILANNFTND